MKITRDLLMKAAKYIQNHKVKCDTIHFDADDEVICFIDADDETVAKVNYVGGKRNTKFRTTKTQKV